jgi:hypothetical protein
MSGLESKNRASFDIDSKGNVIAIADKKKPGSSAKKR